VDSTVRLMHDGAIMQMHYQQRNNLLDFRNV